MKHFTLALALAGLLGMSGGAHAAIVPVNIDNFDSGDQVVSDPTIDGVPVTDTLGGLPTANVAGGARTVSIDVLAYNANIGPTNALTVDTSASLLDIINDSGEDSEARVSWVIPADLIPAGAFGAFFSLSVLQSDGNALSVQFLLNSVSLATFPVPGNTFNQELLFTVDAAQINAGGTLQMVINGEAGWDADFDSVGLAYNDTPPTTTPEPVSLALFGAGLLGLQRLRRRRAA